MIKQLLYVRNQARCWEHKDKHYRHSSFTMEGKVYDKTSLMRPIESYMKSGQNPQWGKKKVVYNEMENHSKS